MIVLGIDPGAGGAGYAVWADPGYAGLDREPLRGEARWNPRGLFWVGDSIESCPKLAFDAIVCESGFVGRMGRKAMWGLGADAGWRMCEARYLRPAEAVYTIRPDGKLGWRAALPSVQGTFQEYDGPPGEVIVKRLRARYSKMFPGLDWSAPTEHEIEAVGIAEAAAAILQRPKAGQRKALVKVKR